jgi:hypothetical protein
LLKSNQPIAEEWLRLGLRNEYSHAAHLHRGNPGRRVFGLGAGAVASAELRAGRPKPIGSERKARRPYAEGHVDDRAKKYTFARSTRATKRGGTRGANLRHASGRPATLKSRLA